MRWLVRYGHNMRQWRGFRKTKFVIFSGPRNRRHSTPQRTTQETNQGGHGAKDRNEGKPVGHRLYWSFCGKGKAGKDKQFRIV